MTLKKTHAKLTIQQLTFHPHIITNIFSVILLVKSEAISDRPISAQELVFSRAIFQ